MLKLLTIIFLTFMVQAQDGADYPDCERHFSIAKIRSLKSFFQKYPELDISKSTKNNYFPSELLSKYSINELNRLAIIKFLKNEERTISTTDELKEWTDLALKILLNTSDRKGKMLVQIVGFFLSYAEDGLDLMRSDPTMRSYLQKFLDLADALSFQAPRYKTELIEIKENSPNQARDRVFKYSDDVGEYWSLISLKFYLDHHYFEQWIEKLDRPTQKDYDELRYISHNINHVFLNIFVSKMFKHRISQLELKFINFYKKDIQKNGLNTANLLGLLEVADTHGQKSSTIQKTVLRFINPLYEKDIQVPSFTKAGQFENLRDFKKMKVLRESAVSNGWVKPINSEEAEMRERLVNYIVSKKKISRPVIDMETRMEQLKKEGKNQHELISILREEGYFNYSE